MSCRKLPELKNTKHALCDSLQSHVIHTLSKEWERRDERDLAESLALSLRDRMVERMMDTRDRYHASGAKRMYYFSIEYLLGRCLGNNLWNMKLDKICFQLMKDLGADLEEVREMERDPALGNGGLGRLAACFLDSLATMDLPGCGYGIHYEYGLFRQVIENGEQVERPDYWMAEGMPLQVERKDEAVVIPIGGRVEDTLALDGSYNPMWLDWEDLIGVPYDIPIVGYGGKTVNYLRLFAARASSSFNMTIFNQGDYIQAVHDRIYSELVSRVLYPSENISFGRKLRLSQEYFLAACSLRDITRRFLRVNSDLTTFPQYVAIQLNDTHPAVSVAELMRLFVDEHRMPWETAWDVTTKTFAFTNHTLLPEALETWPVDLFQEVLPRHLQIIYEINRRFLNHVGELYPGDTGKLSRVSLIEESGGKKVRMAHLSVVGSHSVNGVSALHSELVKTNLFPDFHDIWPEKFNNKTNGITPRRWLYKSNPGLSTLISETIGSGWVTDLDKLNKLSKYAEDRAFQKKFMAVKRGNKVRLSNHIKKHLGLSVSPDSVFDIQAKRIHEYKRQLLNVLHIIHEYLRITEDKLVPAHPKTYIFAGKAAPGYFEAKSIIKLVNNLAKVINRDKDCRDLLKVVFLPDYRVSLAEKIIPATDVSEQISTAGTEASGTGNMKFALNGALTIGTLDGANIEMMEEVGRDHFFIFGLTTEQVHKMLGEREYRPWEYYNQHPEIKRVLDAITANRFSRFEPGIFQWVHDKLLSFGEQYCHLADFMSYVRTHERLLARYTDKKAWAKSAILNTARMGKFSSDRTIAEYSRDIWDLKPVPPEKKTRGKKK